MKFYWEETHIPYFELFPHAEGETKATEQIGFDLILESPVTIRNSEVVARATVLLDAEGVVIQEGCLILLRTDRVSIEDVFREIGPPNEELVAEGDLLAQLAAMKEHIFPCTESCLSGIKLYGFASTEDEKKRFQEDYKDPSLQKILVFLLERNRFSME